MFRKSFNGRSCNLGSVSGGERLKAFRAVALDGFPLVKFGDDVAKLIVDVARENGVEIEDGDVVVVAQKILSKAENRVVELGGVVPSESAREIAEKTGKSSKFVELVLRETEEVLKVSPEILLVRDKRGLVCINAGIDVSNVEGEGNFALLPLDPDRSAEKCRVKIRELTNKNVAVVVCDTYSRPFRRGQVNFAIGFSGVNPFKDYRGKVDLFGRVLKVKNVAVVDEIAAAAELLMGQGEEGTPVVIFKGLAGVVEFCEGYNIGDVQISREEDLFRDAL